MEGEKIKISDLKLSDERKAQLAWLIKPRRTVEFAAKFDYGYNYSSQMLSIWAAKGWLTKIKTMEGKVIYKLDQRVIEL